MNVFTFENLEVGQSEGFTVQVTKEMHDNFTKTTGDINPMHIDTEYAKSQGFNDILVYGMLTASFYSTLVGVYLPGKYCLFHECNTSFNRPVYINDTLSIKGTIIEKTEVPINRITIKAIIKNQKNETVSRAKLVVGISK